MNTKKERQHDFRGESGGDAVLSRRVFAIAVGRESSRGRIIPSRQPLEDHEQYRRCEDPSENLRYDISGDIPARDFLLRKSPTVTAGLIWHPEMGPIA